jgi:hypothetical protein
VIGVLGSASPPFNLTFGLVARQIDGPVVLGVPGKQIRKFLIKDFVIVPVRWTD